MNTIKPMSAVNLIQCLAGEMLVEPALMVETIKEDKDLFGYAESVEEARENILKAQREAN